MCCHNSPSQVSDLDFLDSILVLGFSEVLNKELLQLYQQHCKEIRAILSEMALDLPHFHDLEWRLDVQLASRSLQRQAQPTVLLCLHTKQGGKRNSLCAHILDEYTVWINGGWFLVIAHCKTPHFMSLFWPACSPWGVKLFNYNLTASKNPFPAKTEHLNSLCKPLIHFIFIVVSPPPPPPF